MSDKILKYVITDPLELNLSYMPFITNGGLFIPTNDAASLGEKVLVELQFTSRNEILKIEGKVIWITPRNALHHVLPGVGIQFVGEDATTIRGQIEKNLEPSMEVGGYTYGITDGATKQSR